MLDSKAPLDPAMADPVAALPNRPFDEVLAIAHRTMNDFLLNSGAGLAVIKALKDYGKELFRSEGRTDKQGAAPLVCYTVIASALVFHRHKITWLRPSSQLRIPQK